MKKFLLAVTAITMLQTVNAQKETKYAKIFYKDVKAGSSDIEIVVDNAVSTDAETKFKLKIVNKTKDFLLYKPEESKFLIDGKELKPTEKMKVIEPFSDNFVTVNIKGSYNTIKSYSYLIDGLYKVPASEKGIPTPDYMLPVNKNEFKTGDYVVKLDKLSKESDGTTLKLEVLYTGEKLGIIYPERTGVLMPDGKEYATLKPSGLLAKSGPVLLQKGEKETVTFKWDRMEGGRAMDMQKVDMLVKFNEMFTEGVPEKLNSETIKLEFDETTSNAKGK
jgi:hypothetical protein